MGDPEIKEIVLDVLKAHEPPLPDFASFLCELEGVIHVDISLVEMDEKTVSLKVILGGNDIDFEKLKEHIGERGAVIHSVDQVIVERKI